MKIFKIIEKEIDSYLNEITYLAGNIAFSQRKLIKNIINHELRHYPYGQLDSEGDYRIWFDIISPRINAEVKNLDFDTKDILIDSDLPKDNIPNFVSNLSLKRWLRDNGQAGELNESVEQFSGWGNVVWKKIKDGYERIDLSNFYLSNVTAKTLKDTVAIERHQMNQSELRSKGGIWKNVNEVIEECGNKTFQAEKDQMVFKDTENKFYEIYERNGEISEKDLFEAQGKNGGDENKYILAKIVVAGLKKGQEKDDDKFILYADTISKMPYKEAHRGKYKGRWMREGLVELLFDCQYRANTIGNQLAKGLEWASKVIFRSSDQLIVQNVHTDMKNGEIIRSQDLQQIVLRMTGFDQLVNDWNRIIQLADAIANSYEVVTGESLPSGTPFRLAATLNINANKLFDFLREKLGLAFQELFQDWILPDLIKDLRAKEILKLTGDSDYLNRYYELVVNGWYIENLLRLPPHTKEQAEILKQNKLNEIKQRPEQLIELEEGLLDDYQPKASVIITGENLNLNSELETLSSFIALEQDPIRRTALIELAMKKKGIDVGSLPKSENVQTIPINNISQKAGTSLTQE